MKKKITINGICEKCGHEGIIEITIKSTSKKDIIIN